ncbi:Hsp20/alpha crystallin family protein [Desulforegula conservatrix]|uniref:Hsp20/alpha crystallin family protein n=1 Tax=Desulforegula conservatrix TaxID=153026 RepID=UPI0004037DE7|nr:Hsp20/alpha crystallin family protein [Desulforegula conservatrix]
MAIVRWEPFRNVATLQDRINRMFDDVFTRAAAENDDEAVVGGWRPSVDIIDKTDSIVINAELPGVAKEDVSVEVKENILTLKGERKIEKEEADGLYYRKERLYGKFQRSFTLPMETDSEKIKASFKDGVLNLEIPKPEEKKPKQVTINIE